ncbi:MAG TPA: sulfatase-like hydrolase/transferase [Pirellulales bacterium]|nr:sulfatase-like hydrolase/transferase [Pirellulales bacterium]
MSHVHRFAAVAVVITATLASWQTRLLAAEATRGPNVVFIVSDDQGWTDYGFMGHEHIRTPNIDRLAGESLAFRNAYVPSSLCRPSLMTMLTGLYPHQHRITSNDPPLPAGKKGREIATDATFLAQRERMIDNIDRVPTLPRMMQEQGYQSFQTGKWWEGDFRRGGFTDGMSLGGRHGDKGLDIARVTMQPMFDFLDRVATAHEPFFLWYAPMLPHTPHNPPEKYLEHYQSIAPSPSIARYWAMCEWFDETVGELLAYLDTKGLRENTLIVYLADNGWIQQEKSDAYAPRSKQSPYNGGLRTPLLLRLPGRIAPESSDSLASSIDLAPTVLKLVGLAPTAQMQGINLLDAKARAARHTIFGECFEHNAVDIDRPSTSLKWRWCIHDSWKLIVPHAPNVKASDELYDLSADPNEEHNVAERSPKTAAELHVLLDRWWPAM